MEVHIKFSKVTDEYGVNYFHTNSSELIRKLNEISEQALVVKKLADKLDNLSYKEIKKAISTENKDPYSARNEFFNFVYIFTTPIYLIFSNKPSLAQMRRALVEYKINQRQNIHKAIDLSRQLSNEEIEKTKTQIHNEFEKLIPLVMEFIAEDIDVIYSKMNEMSYDKLDTSFNKKVIDKNKDYTQEISSNDLTVTDQAYVSDEELYDEAKKGFYKGLGAAIAKALFMKFFG